MAEFRPIVTVRDYLTLHPADIDNGFHYGASGGADIGNRQTRSFWHGWRCGQVTAGLRAMTVEEAMFCHEARFINDPPSLMIH